MFTSLIIFLLLLLLLPWNVYGVTGSDENEIPCCYSGNHSIVDILNNVTNNTIINISTDVVLSSNVIREGLNNITIIGQGNPTVKCSGIGSVKFVSCNNVTIEGISWKRCGFKTQDEAYTNSGIAFYSSSSIAIQNCSFHHSTGQAVVLLKVSGNVYITNCLFTHNKYYNHHGAAIYYTSSLEQSTQVQLVINKL